MSDSEDIINFTFLYDDKKTPLYELEDKIVNNLKDLTDIDKIKLFYLNHLDLFIKNQNKFKNVIRNQYFLDEYMKYRITFADIKNYIDSLGLYTSLTPITPLSPLPPSPSSPSSPTVSKGSKSSRFSGIFQKKYPTLSIFNKIDPIEFSRICNKMYLCYYFLTEIREYQFYSRVSTREIGGYAEEFENYYNNFYRKLESEIEIFCEANEFSLLADTFIILSTYFLDIGNIPFAQICISLMDRFQICKENKVKEFLDTYKLSLPLNALSLKDYKKFSYLVDPVSINRAFITAQETENKIKTFSFIQTKMVKTKEEIISINITSTKSSYDDFIVFNYINPKTVIKEKQYKTSSPGSIDYLCIQQKCKHQKGGFDKKHTIHPRKWSKE